MDIFCMCIGCFLPSQLLNNHTTNQDKTFYVHVLCVIFISIRVRTQQRSQRKIGHLCRVRWPSKRGPKRYNTHCERRPRLIEVGAQVGVKSPSPGTSHHHHSAPAGKNWTQNYAFYRPVLGRMVAQSERSLRYQKLVILDKLFFKDCPWVVPSLPADRYSQQRHQVTCSLNLYQEKSEVLFTKKIETC